MKKLAVVITHPIQYYSPLFKLIAERNKIKIKIFYTWSQAKQEFFDEKFGKKISWDIPLLEGYEYEFIENTAKKPDVNGFFGLDNPELIPELEKYNADAILIFGWNHKSHFQAMRYFKGKIPVLFRGDSHLLDEVQGIKTFLRRNWLRFVYKYVDYAFYVGTYNKEYYLKHGLTEKQLIFAPHAIDNERFYDKYGSYQSQADSWKKELGIAEDDTVYLFAGKFEPKKAPIFLLKTFMQLKDKNKKLIFVGNGILEEEMREIADERVIFLPFQNQSKMPVVYRLADYFVLPSIFNETWGLAVNEAMASERAVLVSDKVGCSIDLVKNDYNGYVFKSQNTESLIRLLKTTDKIKAKELGYNSKNIIPNWSFEKIAESIENFLNEKLS